MPEYLHPFIAVRRCYTAICRPGKASIFKVGIIIADLVQEFVAWGIIFQNVFVTEASEMGRQILDLTFALICSID